jgi:NitT/TauT family transport system permease protein
MLALMIVILVIGILVDTIFGRADLAIRRRWGLVDHAG